MSLNLGAPFHAERHILWSSYTLQIHRGTQFSQVQLPQVSLELRRVLMKLWQGILGRGPNRMEQGLAVLFDDWAGLRVSLNHPGNELLVIFSGGLSLNGQFADHAGSFDEEIVVEQHFEEGRKLCPVQSGISGGELGDEKIS